MKKIKFTDPETFEEKEQQFDDFQYELAEDIKKFAKEKYKIDLTTEIISNKDGDKLFVGLLKHREPGENSKKYRITIEKINSVE